MEKNLEELLKKSNDYIAENNFDMAIKALEKAYSIDDSNVDILKNLGLCYHKINQNTQAQEFFDKVLKLDPEDATSLYYSGAINLLNKDYERAKELFEKVLEIRKEYIDAYKNLGIVYFSIKDTKKAVEVFEQGLEYADEDVEYYRLLASAYIVNKENQHAINLIEAFFERTNIKTFELYNLLGSGYLGIQNPIKAREAYLNSIVLNDQNNTVAQKALNLLNALDSDAEKYHKMIKEKASIGEVVNASIDLIERNKVDEAIGFLKFALDTGGYEHPKIFFTLSALYEMKGQFNDALLCLYKILNMQEATKPVEIKLVQLFLQLDKMTEAFAVLNKMVKKYPYEVDIYYTYANAFILYGDLIKAEEYLKKTIEMNPESSYSALAHKDLGCIYLQQSNMDYARDEFQKALDLHPDNDAICYEYASFNFIEGNYVIALKYYEKAISLNPRNEEYKVAVALLYNKFEDYQKTINILMPLVKNIHQMPKIAYPLAEAFYHTGKYEFAEDLFLSYCEKTQDMEAFNMLALTYEKQGKYKQALDIINKILKTYPDNINLLCSKGRVLSQLEEYMASEDVYMDILSELPKYEDAMLGLLEMYQSSNQLNKAKDLVARLDYDDFSNEACEIFGTIKNMYTKTEDL